MFETLSNNILARGGRRRGRTTRSTRHRRAAGSAVCAGAAAGNAPAAAGKAPAAAGKAPCPGWSRVRRVRCVVSSAAVEDEHRTYLESES